MAGAAMDSGEALRVLCACRDAGAAQVVKG
jgi:hypothetical protein